METPSPSRVAYIYAYVVLCADRKPAPPRSVLSLEDFVLLVLFVGGGCLVGGMAESMLAHWMGNKEHAMMLVLDASLPALGSCHMDAPDACSCGPCVTLKVRANSCLLCREAKTEAHTLRSNPPMQLTIQKSRDPSRRLDVHMSSAPNRVSATALIQLKFENMPPHSAESSSSHR